MLLFYVIQSSLSLRSSAQRLMEEPRCDDTETSLRYFLGRKWAEAAPHFSIRLHEIAVIDSDGWRGSSGGSPSVQLALTSKFVTLPRDMNPPKDKYAGYFNLSI